MRAELPSPEVRAGYSMVLAASASATSFPQEVSSEEIEWTSTSRALSYNDSRSWTAGGTEACPSSAVPASTTSALVVPGAPASTTSTLGALASATSALEVLGASSSAYFAAASVASSWTTGSPRSALADAAPRCMAAYASTAH